LRKKLNMGGKKSKPETDFSAKVRNLSGFQ